VGDCGLDSSGSGLGSVVGSVSTTMDLPVS
jgi:hypothetical protein